MFTCMTETIGQSKIVCEIDFEIEIDFFCVLHFVGCIELV